jgi:hypothetical protein
MFLTQKLWKMWANAALQNMNAGDWEVPAE